ncbi:MAG: hypothetical protein QGG71_06585 [Pirellulaceae bacterium]|nr:hypothetical protein [Pirellulaceae bacterium]
MTRYRRQTSMLRKWSRLHTNQGKADFKRWAKDGYLVVIPGDTVMLSVRL